MGCRFALVTLALVGVFVRCCRPRRCSSWPRPVSWSSPRFHRWLLDTRLFGPLLREWEATGSIPLGATSWALTLMALVGGASLVWFVRPWWARAAMITTLVLVAVWILRRPTSRKTRTNTGGDS
jgi:hypothetical protein